MEINRIKGKISDLESKLWEYKLTNSNRLNASGCAGARYRKLVAGYFKGSDRIEEQIKKWKSKLLEKEGYTLI